MGSTFVGMGGYPTPFKIDAWALLETLPIDHHEQIDYRNFNHNIPNVHIIRI